MKDLSPYSTEKRDPTQMKSTPKKDKCTWQTLGVTQNVCFVLGGNANFSVFRYQHIKLVYPTQNCGVGGLSQRQDPTRTVLRRSGYRLKCVGTYNLFRKIRKSQCCCVVLNSLSHIYFSWTYLILNVTNLLYYSHCTEHCHVNCSVKEKDKNLNLTTLLSCSS